jgi:nitrate reductase beta subunit
VCNHCTYPACLQACPRTSIYKRPEDGIVLVDQQQCRGYRECTMACPYKKIFYNHVTRLSEKCVFCFPAVEQGIQPRCMRNCIGKIRSFGFVSTPDKAREDNPIDLLVHDRKVALPLYPQFGLEPNVYYIPPIHAPVSFNRQLFGPGADAAMKTYRNAMNDPDLAGLLCLFGSTESIVPRFRRQGDIVVGTGEKGEILRVPLREPAHVRPAVDPKNQLIRINCP